MAPSPVKASVLLAIAVGAVLVTLAFILSDPWAVVIRIANANPLYVALACLFDFASIAFFAFAWVAAAKATGVEIGFIDGFVASVLGLMADKLVASASVSGELVRLAYVRSKRNAGYAEFLATIVVHRFLYNVAFILLLAAASVDIAARGVLPQAVSIVTAMAILSTLIASYVLLRPESLKGVSRRLARYADRLVARLYNVHSLSLGERVDSFVEAVAMSVRGAWGRKGYMILATVLMLFQWLAGALELNVLFTAVGYDVDFWVVLLSFPLHCYLTALPVGIPAALGVTEVGTLVILSALGVERSAAMAVTILVRFVEVWFELALGAIVAAAAGVTLLTSRLEWTQNLLASPEVAHGGSRN
ncbi:MAG: flippase-like domain-containing protein [Thermofilaceae archaeon]